MDKEVARTLLFLALVWCGVAQATPSYSPSDVFSGAEYANKLAGEILASKGVQTGPVPRSMERTAKPMHVYELSVSVLAELYQYALKNKRRPPPMAISTPIKYTPTDVYYLNQLVVNNLEEIYQDTGNTLDFSRKSHSGKTPSQVYQEIFALYYRLNLMNGKNKVSPNEVYSHIYRVTEDLQDSLLTLSNRLDDEDKQRMLVTATYGMHPDATTLSPLESGKKPIDVLERALVVRGKLNQLRRKYALPEIKRPDSGSFGKVRPIDVFLQTQFIIAELNLLKMPMDINSTTNSPKPVTGKTPSDVYQQMKYVEYMLNRVLAVL
ncbi:hypothetical protein MNBD_GAMMA13-1721 [hydrothermal vent metagenome]|uniref:Uncharacterized protein n=1 Tax=hydrothermal vent metagenome TaxID=652676 RepID=A0A3B0Z6D7_9ZZZZ